MRQSRSFAQHNDLVIVCEGSTTEYNYFREIREMIGSGYFPSSPYTRIHVIPGDSPDNTATGRPQKSFYGSRDDMRYFEKSETNRSDYNKYCSQPVRYVREAELFLLDTKAPYDEAWAVYDWDVKEDNPDEKKHGDVIDILDRNKGNLNIAFSSYSFEEWLLMHFEKNDYQFTASDCSDKDKQSYMCGTHPATYEGHDCQGKKCIAGRLRVKHYIPTYNKELEKLFSTYTYSNGKLCIDAFYNAAWLRSRSHKYTGEAYTNVDELVCKLIGHDERIVWIKAGDPVPLNASVLQICREQRQLIITNKGHNTALLKYKNFSLTLDPQKTGKPLPLSNPVDVLPPSGQVPIPLDSDEYRYLRIIDDNKILIVEL